MKKGHYPYLYKVDEVANEETVVLRNGAQYIQFPVSDHLRPTDKVIDKFITFVKNLPDEVWLHFHCSAGKGRTTTFLAMYDMMKNATNATVDEIVNRQQSYGGMNLFKEYDEDDWRIIHFEDRVSFINNFYQYCIENPDFDLSWSEWEEKRSFLQ